MIELIDLHKEFSEPGGAREVLRGVSGRIDDGEFVAIRGRSGSGKTTLLNLIAGIDLPSRGEVRMNGATVSRMNAKQRTHMRRSQVGFIFQFFNLIPTLSAAENVALPLLLEGRRFGAVRAQAEQLLADLRLSERAEHAPSELSGGEMQRVALARALITHPRVVLADEPTGNLDSAASAEILALLRRACDERGTALVLVTHDARVAARADRVIHFRDGRVADEAAPGAREVG